MRNKWLAVTVIVFACGRGDPKTETKGSATPTPTSDVDNAQAQQKLLVSADFVRADHIEKFTLKTLDGGVIDVSMQMPRDFESHVREAIQPRIETDGVLWNHIGGIDGPSIHLRVGEFNHCTGPEDHIPKTEPLEGGTLIVCIDKQYVTVQRTISTAHGTVVALVHMKPRYDSASGEIMLPDDVMKQRTLDATALMESIQLSSK